MGNKGFNGKQEIVFEFMDCNENKYPVLRTKTFKFFGAMFRYTYDSRNPGGVGQRFKVEVYNSNSGWTIFATPLQIGEGASEWGNSLVKECDVMFDLADKYIEKVW